MKRLLISLALAATVACATFHLKNPDGSINVPVLLDYAQYGIDADCKFGTGALAADVCTFGDDTIAIARTKDPKDVKQFLANAIARVPAIGDYLGWLNKYL